MNLVPVVQEYLYNNGTQLITFGNGTRPDISLSCPTRKCTWPTYETLAVYSSCVDVSESLDLKFACVNMTIDWTVTWTGPSRDGPYPSGTACGYFLNATSATSTFMSGYTRPNSSTNHTVAKALLVRALPLTKFLTKERLYDTGSIHFESIRNSIMDSLLASARNGTQSVYQGDRPLIHECLLSWCVQTLKSSYDSGSYHEEVEAIYQNTTARPSSWINFRTINQNENDGQWIQYTENITIMPPWPNSDPSRLDVMKNEYGMSNETVNLVMAQFDDFFPSYYTSLNGSTVS